MVAYTFEICTFLTKFFAYEISKQNLVMQFFNINKCVSRRYFSDYVYGRFYTGKFKFLDPFFCQRSYRSYHLPPSLILFQVLSFVKSNEFTNFKFYGMSWIFLNYKATKSYKRTVILPKKDSLFLQRSKVLTILLHPTTDENNFV